MQEPVTGAAMERMTTLDAGFFFVEHKNVPMHLGSLMVFEGPAPAAGRCSRGCTTAWWTASAAPT